MHGTTTATGGVLVAQLRAALQLVLLPQQEFHYICLVVYVSDIVTHYRAAELTGGQETSGQPVLLHCRCLLLLLLHLRALLLKSRFRSMKC